VSKADEKSVERRRRLKRLFFENLVLSWFAKGLRAFSDQAQMTIKNLKEKAGKWVSMLLQIETA
jgi:hypothetical protein